MKITAHKLEGVPFVAAADHGGALVDRRFGVIHYTAGGSVAGALRALTAKDSDFVSAHVLIGRDGSVYQTVPFDQIAYHAGKSAWQGYTGLNTRSLGIELVNPGWRRPGYDYAWPSIKACHANGGAKLDWYLYPDAQIASLVQVMRALRASYATREWVGHDQIAPGRKSDPGPAFPWPAVRAAFGAP